MRRARAHEALRVAELPSRHREHVEPRHGLALQQGLDVVPRDLDRGRLLQRHRRLMRRRREHGHHPEHLADRRPLDDDLLVVRRRGEGGRHANPQTQDGHRTVYQADIFDATGTRIRKSFRTKGEAEDWLAEQKIEAGKPHPVVSAHRNATVQAWWDAWELQQTAIEPATLESYRRLFTKYIAPTLGALRVRDIHRGHIRALLSTKRQTLSGNCTRLIRATLSVLLGDAVGDGIIAENPARVLAQERRKRPDRVSKTDRTKHIRPLSKADLATVLIRVKAWCSPRDAALYLTLADTGLRPSEALALPYGDFDPVTRTLHVAHAVSSAGASA